MRVFRILHGHHIVVAADEIDGIREGAPFRLVRLEIFFDSAQIGVRPAFLVQILVKAPCFLDDRPLRQDVDGKASRCPEYFVVENELKSVVTDT